MHTIQFNSLIGRNDLFPSAQVNSRFLIQCTYGYLKFGEVSKAAGAKGKPSVIKVDGSYLFLQTCAAYLRESDFVIFRYLHLSRYLCKIYTVLGTLLFYKVKRLKNIMMYVYDF